MRILGLIAAVLIAGGLAIATLAFSPTIAARTAMAGVIVTGNIRVMLSVLNDPENCRHIAHAIVAAALMIEAWAIWQHARDDKHRRKLRTVAAMFVVAAGLGLASLTLESATPLPSAATEFA